MTQIVTPEQRAIASEVKNLTATYREAENLINIGAYVEGSNPKIDRAIEKNPDLESFLKQDLSETGFEGDLWERLKEIIK